MTTLPFLDTRLHHMEGGTIQTSVYRKPTHTVRYLDYMSHHPIEHKKGVVQILCTRAERLSLTANKKSSEVKHIFNVLNKNGYPKQVIQNHFKALESKPNVLAEDKDDTITVVLPYVKDVSEAMRRILARANIRTTFRPCSTLKHHLVKPKDPFSPEKKLNVVYSVPCKVALQCTWDKSTDNCLQGFRNTNVHLKLPTTLHQCWQSMHGTNTIQLTGTRQRF